MSQKLPNHYPITAICIVSDAQKCPPGYDLLLKSHDKREDCDLWREGGMFKRPSRYLCFTRAFPLNGRNDVLAGIQILNEKDFPPTGYSLIERTVDSSEKASRKRTICIKTTDRDSTSEAVNDIILLTKTKRPPEGYSFVGDVNGVVICMKLGKVPAETQNFQHASSALQPHAPNIQRPAPPPPIAGYGNGVASPYVAPVAAPPRSDILARPTTGTIKRADSTLAQNPLADVAFQLNVKHQSGRSALSFQIPEVLYRSLIDIENEYNYSFTLEKSAVQRLPSCNE